MAEEAGQSSGGLVIATGWELHCTSGGSDKYYRVVHAGDIVIVNWGRTGTAGGVKVHRPGVAAAARSLARELTDQKRGRGYAMVRDATEFPIAATVTGLARSGGGTQEHTEVAQDLIAMFLQVAAYNEGSRR